MCTSDDIDLEHIVKIIASYLFSVDYRMTVQMYWKSYLKHIIVNHEAL